MQVRVCARRVPLLESLQKLGAEIHYLDASRSHQFGPALLGLDEPVVVYSIPGVRDLPQGEAARRAATAALKIQARAFIYLGSSAVYGRSEGNRNDEWVDEDSPIATGDPEASIRLTEEAAIQSVSTGGLRTILLRLSAIYGPALSPSQPARGVRQRLRGGQYKLSDGGRYFFSRIHVDDLVRVIRRIGEQPGDRRASSLYVVGDDNPCPQKEYATWLSEHLQLPLPPDAGSHLASGPGHAIRGHRLRNDRLKRELGLSLLYPTFREGEAQLDACEQAGRPPPLSMTAKDPPAVAAPALTPAEKPPLPKATLKTAEPGVDFGVAVGGPRAGVSLLKLLPGNSAPTGKLYLVLSGQLVATQDGQTLQVSPRALIPPEATVHNSGTDPAELLEISTPAS
jgi:hypothetical protein